MTYKSLKEAKRCTQTRQSSKTTQESCGSCEILCIVVICILVLGMPIGLLINDFLSQTKFTVAEASIAHFNLTSNNTLYYKFKVTIIAKHFHNTIESYDKVIAIASYKGNQLASVKMAPFKLTSKNIVRLEPIVFEGNNVMIFDPRQLDKYNKETQLEIYNLDVDLDLDHYRPHIHFSNVKVPLISNGKVAPTFSVTTCFLISNDGKVVPLISNDS